jgi:2-keto-3-deoxy-L-rhamnonate aldolase RhmA
MPPFVNQAKRRLSNGDLALGFILRQSRTVDIASIGKACGFDWLSIDLEHSSLDVDTAGQIAAAALSVGISALVRVPQDRHGDAARLLDAGAQGVIVPHVDNAEEARFVVSYCVYPPLGSRSIASVQPQLGFRGVSGPEAMRMVNEQTLVVAMLETPAAIGNADEIAAVKGIDVLLIGSNDLCAELDIPGQFSHPLVADAYRRVAAACRTHGKHAGMSGIHDGDLIEKFVGMGVRFVAGGTDLAFLMKAAEERAGFLRGLHGSDLGGAK